MFEVKIKSGTSGHFNCDGCDLKVAEIWTDQVPNKHDILELIDKENKSNQYFVTEVKRSYLLPTETRFNTEIYTSVYVIKI